MLDRKAMLKAMGIEVWSLRSDDVPAIAVEIQHDSPAATLSALKASVAVVDETASVSADRLESRTTEVVAPAGATSAEPPPTFRYAMLHYGAVGLCVSLAASPGDAGSKPAQLPRRLCDDIAGLLGGDVKAVRFQELKWPMLQASGIDQSINAARQVVTDKFRQLPAKVVVIGSDVGHSLEVVSDIAPYSHGNFGGQQYFLVPSITELMNSSMAKRQLQTALLAWR